MNKQVTHEQCQPSVSPPQLIPITRKRPNLAELAGASLKNTHAASEAHRPTAESGQEMVSEIEITSSQAPSNGRVAAAEQIVDAMLPTRTKDEDAVGLLVPIPAESIIPNRYQPRKRFGAASLQRLAESIRQYGILQPITVRQLAGTQPPKFEIICGERRFRAGLMAGLDVFRCYLMQESDLHAAEMSVIENLLRDELNIFEQAEAFQLLISTFGLTQQQVADRIGLSQSAVANKLRLLKLSGAERQGILENELSERHARCLLRLEDPAVRMKFIQLVARDKLNVSATEQLVDKYIKYTTSSASTNRAVTQSHHPRVVGGILRDVRVFSNSIEKAADILRNSGIFVETSCEDAGESYIYTIRVVKKTGDAGTIG